MSVKPLFTESYAPRCSPDPRFSSQRELPSSKLENLHFISECRCAALWRQPGSFRGVHETCLTFKCVLWGSQHFSSKSNSNIFKRIFVVSMGWNKPWPRLTYDCGADDKPNCHICIQQLIMFVFLKLNERENRKSSNTSLFFIYCIQLLACTSFIALACPVSISIDHSYHHVNTTQ